MVDRLDDVLASGDRSALGALIRYLSDSQNPYEGDAIFYCLASAHGGAAKRRRARGYQRWRLETSAWVPVRNDPLGTSMRPPTEAWTGSRLPKWLLVPQARVRPENAQALRLVQAERPGPAAIEQALVDLEQAYPELADAPEGVRDTAEWLIKRLDRALQGRDATRDDAPPMPSTSGGRRAWSSEPIVPDMFGLDQIPEIALLAPGPWRGLRKGYGVRRASEVIDQELRLGSGLRAPRILSREQRGRLAAVLTAHGADEDKTAAKLARLRESTFVSIEVRYRLAGEAQSPFLPRPYHLDLRRDTRNRVIGASLYTTIPLTAASRIAIGRDLAGYLDAPDLQSAIGLFLTSPEAVVESEGLTEEDIAEAERRLASHLRGRDTTDDSPDDEVLGTPAGLGEEEPEDTESGTPDESQTGATATSPGADGGVVEPLVLPPIRHEAVEASDVASATTPASTDGGEPPSRRGSGGGGGGRGPGATDWARLEEERRLYGKRGEEVAFESEKRRVRAAGFDPSVVKWVSKINELSPYDIESVEPDGQPRYIEVKATSGSDPTDAFPISAAELAFGTRRGHSYFIYRVTDVRTDAPQIYRYQDPIGELSLGHATIRWSRASLALPAAPPT